MVANLILSLTESWSNLVQLLSACPPVIEFIEPKILNDVMETSLHSFLVSACTKYTLYKQLGKQPVVILLFYKIFGRLK